MKLTIRYFASIREALGSSETLEIGAPATVGDVRERLIASSPAHAEQLARGKALRMALDQELAEDSAPVRDGSVVAFFPPVTGG
jgi:molybdopterin synthase sulfur carrier subunit